MRIGDKLGAVTRKVGPICQTGPVALSWDPKVKFQEIVTKLAFRG